jgi:uncharacterized membrane protein YhaH (DUF805 family)
MNYYFQAFKQYADFSGRANRTEFWMFFLFNCLAVFIFCFIFGIAGLMSYPDGMILPSILLWLYVLATFIPNLAITVRRLRDAGESGWMILVSLIPFAGAIWLIVLLCKESVGVTNEYDVNLNYAEKETYASAATNPNVCSHCGCTIDADTSFCENCGNKIK